MLFLNKASQSSSQKEKMTKKFAKKKKKEYNESTKKFYSLIKEKMKKQITVILGVVTFTTLSLLVAFPDQVMQWFSPTEESITLYGEVQQPLLAEELSEISDIPEIVD
jgi:multidrug efflux pump subunit AcrB